MDGNYQEKTSSLVGFLLRLGCVDPASPGDEVKTYLRRGLSGPDRSLAKESGFVRGTVSVYQKWLDFPMPLHCYFPLSFFFLRALHLSPLTHSLML